MTDDTADGGQLEVMYEYRAFGEQLKRLDANGDETGDTAKYSYGGKELDDGTNLYYFNARYYDATIGRFINVDPIQDGSNWYVYCRNNPMKLIDPTGLRSGEKWKQANQLNDLKKIHQIDQLSPIAQEKFTNYFYLTGKIFEMPKQDCATFANKAGSEFAKVMFEISQSEGKSTAEKVSNYLKNNSDVESITEKQAMEYANKGRNVLVVGNYYVDVKGFKGFTTHYAIVAPSFTAINGEEYSQKHLKVNSKEDLGATDPNKQGSKTGVLVANTGYASGFSSFSYAYNRKSAGITESKHGTEAVVFILLPENNNNNKE